jgi:hypothetical protein
VVFPEEPIPVGTEATLQVTYQADHPEQFKKGITLYMNSAASPVRLYIKGEAVERGKAAETITEKEDL